ncbi:hypothetical protein Chor_002028 [Crotalus horridus]
MAPMPVGLQLAECPKDAHKDAASFRPQQEGGGDGPLARNPLLPSSLNDQFDTLEKHTQWGIDILEKYIKFVKDRTEIEINYAKQLRYSSCRAFLATLNEMNDYAGQHEVISENMTSQITTELARYVQELKQERKSSKRRFERDCKEADRAQQYFEKMDADINVTKADVEKARQQAPAPSPDGGRQQRRVFVHLTEVQTTSSESITHTHIPNIFQKIQDMEERRIIRIGESMKTFAEVDRQVTPIIGKCLDEITKAVDAVDPKQDSQLVIDAFKSGFEPPGDVDFEDFTQPIKRAVSESSLSNSKEGKSESRFSSKSKGKLWPFIKKNKLMSLLTPPYQPPPLPPSSASPSALPNGPQSPKQPKEPLSHRFNEFMTSKPKIHCFRSLKRGQQSQSLYFDKEHMKRRLGRATYAVEAREYIVSPMDGVDSPGHHWRNH